MKVARFVCEKCELAARCCMLIGWKQNQNAAGPLSKTHTGVLLRTDKWTWKEYNRKTKKQESHSKEVMV
eukprot:gene12140-25062_t